MKVRLDFGAEVDLLNADELDASLERWSGNWLARAQGVKYMRYTNPSPQLTQGAVLLGGPRQGYAWDLKLVSVNVSAAAAVTVWLGEGQQYAIGSAQAAAAGPVIFTWGSHAAVIPGGTQIALATSAGTLSNVLRTAVEVPQEMLGKLIS
jgi:hypothetical protein